MPAKASSFTQSLTQLHSLAQPLDVDDVDDDVENDIQDDVDDDVDDDIQVVIITEPMASVSVMTRSTDSAPTAKYSPIVPAALKHYTNTIKYSKVNYIALETF